MANRQAYIGSPDNPRTTAIVAYITFIGWIISYFFLYRNNKDSFSAFHIRQSLLIHIISFLIKVAFSFSFLTFSFWDIVIGICAIALFILWLLGLWDALNGVEKRIPLIGNAAQSIFKNL